MIPDIAIGAIVAAVIGGLISLVGLIISKESKVSEFRQAWIDALRAEFSTYLTNVNAAADAKNLVFSSENERFEKLHPFFSKLNESYFLIALRLNANESQSKKVQECTTKLANLIKSNDQIDQVVFQDAQVNFIKSSNQLLKDEWNRVKNGESVYRNTRRLAALTVVTLCVVAAFALVERASQSAGVNAIGSAQKSSDEKGGEVRPSKAVIGSTASEHQAKAK